MALKFSRERGVTWERPPETKSIPGMATIVSPELEDAVRWGTLNSGWGGLYRSSMAVYTVGQFLAWQIAQVGLKFYRRVSASEREPIDELNAAIKAPAPGLTYQRLMETLVWDRILFGNAYWRLTENDTQRVIMPLPPFAMTPRGGNLVQAASYDYELNGTTDRFAADTIAHFRTYNPVDGRVGVSPLEPLRPLLREEREMSLHRIGYWRNGARVEGVIERPADNPWTDEGWKRFREQWQTRYSGAGNAGMTAILEGMTYKSASWSPRDSEFIEGRKFILMAVAQELNVPASVLSLSETATYASQQEFREQLYQDTLGPWFADIEGEVNRAVIPFLTDEPDVYCEFNIAEKLQGNFEQTTNALRNAVGVPHLSVNEARALENRPPVDDPDFDVPVKPANVIYGGAGTPGQPPMPDQQPAEPNLRAVDGAG